MVHQLFRPPQASRKKRKERKAMGKVPLKIEGPFGTLVVSRRGLIFRKGRMNREKNFSAPPLPWRFPARPAKPYRLPDRRQQAVQELNAQDAVTIPAGVPKRRRLQIFSPPTWRKVRPGRMGGYGRQSPHLRDVLTASFDKDYFDGKDLSHPVHGFFSLRQKGTLWACHHGAGGHPREARRDLHHPLHRG